MNETPFLLPPEVYEIARMTDVTLKRLEDQGRFPKRIKIGSRKIAWRRSDIEAWVSDPEGWARREPTQNKRDSEDQTSENLRNLL